MSTQVQTRRGNTAQTAAFTGSIAELTVDTDKKVVVVHDGTTVGGIPLSKESTASTIFNHANGAFDKANSANVLAQNAYNFANTITSGPAYTHANGAFDKANSANIIADSAYAFANIANIKIDSAFSFANTINIKTDAAFAFANTVNIKTDAAFTQANSANVLAQAAFDKANTANITAESAFTKANSANVLAQSAFDKANSANIIADSAYAFANTVNIKTDAAFTQANSANVLAQSAFNKANSALANTGGSITGDVTITGNLTIVGQQVYANTQTVLIKDNIITLNAAIDQASAPSANAGLEIDRGSSANVYLLWNENSDVWQFTNDGNTYYTIADTTTLASAFDKANTANITAEAGFSKANSANVLAQAAFEKANSANIIADSAYAFANSVNIKVDSAFSFANTINIKTDGAFSFANTVNILAQAAFNQANIANIKVDSAFAFANTINIKTDAAFAFSNTVNIKVDSAFAFSNTVNIKTDAAFVRANAANVLAQAAFDKANSVTQQGFVTVAANGTNVVADANNDTLTLSAANGVGITSNATTDTITINLTPTGVTSGTYANATHVPVFVVDAQGRLSSVTNTAISFPAEADTLQTVTTRGSTTANAINVTNTTSSTSKTTGALIVAGGIGVSGNVYANAIFTTGKITGTLASGELLAVGDITNAVDKYISIKSLYGSLEIGRNGNTNAYFNSNMAAGTLDIIHNSTTKIQINASDTVIIPQSTASTNTTTGALIVTGGVGVAGNVYANAIYDGGVEVIAFANQAFTQANSANVLAQAAFDKANTDATNITTTAGVYGNASHVPVTTLTANGRVSLITNTAIAIDTSQITSGTIANTRLPNTGISGTYANASHVPVITTDAQGRVTAVTNTLVQIAASQITSGNLAIAQGGTNNNGGYTNGNILQFDGTKFVTLANTATAGTYANSTHIPVITTDAYGRVTAITNTVIQSATTSVQGIVQLNDTVTSTSTSVAATANAVNAVYNFASTKFNSSGGTISGDTTITGNLVVNGTTTTVNTSTVTTNDSLLKLAANNVVGDVLDIGFYGQANTTNTITYHGLVRQAAGNFVLFKNFSQDPSGNVINTAYVTIANTATLRANLTGGTVSSLASAIGVADGGTGATTLTAGRILIGSGTSAVTTLANTGTAGTYANASHVPVITTDAYGRVSAVTNTAIALSADAVTSGTLAVARGGTGVTSSTGTGSVTLNTSPILTTPNIGVPSFAILTNATGLPIVAGTTGTLTIARGGTNQTSFTTGQRILFDGTSLASQANVTTTVTGGLAAANTITALTTNAYGDITAFTGAAIAIDTAQITSGTLAVARGGTGNTSLAVGSILIGSGTNAITTLANTGTAGTYGNSTHIPVVTTDAYGRVSSVTNTAISVSGSGYLANSVIVANSTGYLSNTSNLLYYSANNTLAISGNVTIKSANTSISNSATFVFNSTLNSLDTVFA